MTLRAVLLLILWAALTPGCVTFERGAFAAAAATAPQDLQAEVIAEQVEGRVCARTDLGELAARYEPAVDDALAKAEGANALVDVAWRFEDFCIAVRGKAVRIR